MDLRMPTPFREFAHTVQRLAAAVEDLQRQCDLLQVPVLAGREWYELLRQKLLPQLLDDAFLVVAVCGGTNIGKSVIFNHLAGSRAAATSPLASGTKHPTCLIPPGFSERHNVEAIFGGFQLEERTDPDAALQERPEHMLFWLVSERRPENLLVLDTPDIDSDAQINWQRADHIRRSADVLIAVLTQQKYNDAAVKQFFRKAAAEDKAVIIVFNQCQLPDDEQFWPLWLDTFCSETKIRPELVYVAPSDRRAAEELRLPFYERAWPVDSESRGAADQQPHSLAEDLSRLHFAEIKLRTLRGSLQALLSPELGVPAYLREVDRASGRFRSAAETLSAEKLARMDRWPPVPNAILVEEIRRWWQAQREGWSATVHNFYNTVGTGLAWPFRYASERIRGEQIPPLEQYRRQEWTAVLDAVTQAYDQLTMMSQVGNTLLRDRLEKVLAGTSRAELIARLEAEHEKVDLEGELREIVVTEMRQFKADQPQWYSALRKVDTAAAAARPMLSAALFVVGFGPADAAAQLAGNAAVTTITHVVGDVAGGVTLTAVGETAAGAAGTGVGYLEAKFRRLHAAFAARRLAWLLSVLNEHLWGELLVELRGGAAVTNSEAFVRVRQELRTLEEQLRAGRVEERQPGSRQAG